MKISTRSRYGLRLMLELAINYQKGPIFLRDIAEKEDISEKYLSQIVIALKARNLINSLRGFRGGYVLARSPSCITLKEIVEEMEGGLSLVPCLSNPLICERKSRCATRDIWDSLRVLLAEKLESLTLKDLIRINREKKEKNIMYNI
ncbi:MAG: Rrf2 family transcriptional regulator [Candidatus Omnitrophica bacterium]|nr:Rrf2 family transcriptional regulator [Candidatus Omnitrophota bacterium]MBD3269185.1 Rrf2 family transcriptional regulator [Candidatus Omnitrophota bacterium]